MTKLIFRSGVHTIGGTIVELIDNNTRIIFDFGTVYDPNNEEEKLPRVEGVYDNTSKYDDHVFISHLHLDHTKAMNLVDQNIPIYMSEESVDFLNTLYDCGFDQILGKRREYTKVTEKIKIGEITITPFLVDHDVPGACAFVFQTKDVKIVYTGDIRLHGYKRELTDQFIKACKKQKIDVLISEGVTISFIDDDYQIIASDQVIESESQFAINLQNQLNENVTQYFNPYIMGVERLKTIFDIALKMNKKIALTSASGYIANKYLSEYEFFIIEDDKFNTNREIVTLAEIDDSWFVQFDYTVKDKYLAHMKNSELIQTGGEPLGDFDPRFEKLINELCAHNVKFIARGLGGHATPENLQYICEQINPSFLFPLHSFKPNLLKTKNSQQIIAVEDKHYIFKKGMLIK